MSTATVIEDRRIEAQPAGERRGRERRKGGRVNRVAPRRSLMRVLGAVMTSVTVGLFVIALIAGEVLADGLPFVAFVLLGGMVVVSSFGLMLGSVEQRLIEIRLELMMSNGGMRRSDAAPEGDLRS